MQMYESRLSYFKDKARINYCKRPSFTKMAAPRGLVKTVIPVSLRPKRIRTLEYAFSIQYSVFTVPQYSVFSIHRVRPKFEVYRKSLLIPAYKLFTSPEEVSVKKL